jgi:tRNA/tmRNA/rRNA uracil-C5-methylase (TrmA/RlmC/RlmD family)
VQKICSEVIGLKKGDIVTGIIDHVNFPNRGILKADDLTVTVKDTVPGQQVEARIAKKHGDRADARLLRVIEPSPAECKAPCAHFGTCGGCTWLNLPYEEELKLKEAQVKKLLDQAVEESRGHLQAAGADRPDRVPEETPGYEFQGILPSPVQFGYRNKMEFTFGDEYKDGPLALGMHKSGSNFDLVTVSDCRIVSADYRAVLDGNTGFLRQAV